MNYYTDSKNCCFSGNKNNRYNDEYYYGDFSRNNDKDYYYNDYDKNTHKSSCCVRKVEETFCCFPSYYNEEKKEEKKEKCFEGTFKICPKCFDENSKDNMNCKENDIKKYENKCNCHCHHKCGFCGLFRRW